MDPAIATAHVAEAAPTSRPLHEGRTVIEVTGVSKTFNIPEHKVDSLKERALHPLRKVETRELRAVRDASFTVHEGEFFGIVGRNGSGKSTLLKIMAGIYKADAGRVRMAGRVAPFIELGVGFNPELPARENVVLNGVLLGLSRREAAKRLDAVLDFAELEDFADLKLKNYSSGMMVRLAFSVMAQADADVMLIDEVLAVGDAAFGQKCMDVFHDRRRRGKTIVLVTHDMSTVTEMCHRAMLVQDGEIKFLGDPDDAAMNYLRLNFGAQLSPVDEEGRELSISTDAKVVEATLRDASGGHVEAIEQGAPLDLSVVLQAAHDLEDPLVALHVLNEEGTVVFGVRQEHAMTVRSGERLRLSGSFANPLVPGRYFLDLWIRWGSGTSMGVRSMRVMRFLVYGTAPQFGLVEVDGELQASVEPGA